MSFCSACGTKLKETDRFCPECGASRKADAVVKTKEIESKSQKESTEEAVYRGVERVEKEKSFKKVSGIVGIVALVIAAIIGLASSSWAWFFVWFIILIVIFNMIARKMMGLPALKK
jgi:uncharacterized membrane protein YvbJ